MTSTALDSKCDPLGTVSPQGEFFVSVGPFPDPGKNDGCPEGEFPMEDNGECGDPIFPGTGNNFQSAVDYIGPGLLKIARFYNSGSLFGWTGVGIAEYPYPFPLLQVAVAGSQMQITRVDGSSATFTSTDSGNTWIADPDINDRLTYLPTPASNGAQWILNAADGSTVQFNASHTPIVYTALGGANLQFTMQSVGSPATAVNETVTDDFGRAITYNINATTLNVTATTPGGSVYSYPYDPNSGRFGKVIYPDNKSTQFVYSGSYGYLNAVNYPLLQVIDEKGTAYSTWTYDASGRATSNQLAGGVAKYSIGYSGFSGGANQVSITDPLGTIRGLSYQDNGFGKQMLTASSQPCATCGLNIASKTLGTNGQIAQTTDFRGFSTSYGYDFTRNLPTTITRAAGTGNAQTTTVSWAAGSYREPVTISEAGRTTTIVYDGRGNPLSRTVQDTASGKSRMWKYSWNAHGQLLTKTDPNSNTTQYAYDAAGNLASVTDALLHTTNYLYNGEGWVTQKTDPNGLVTTYGYDPRGHLTSKAVGSEHYGYGYDETGKLTSISLPSGYGLTFGYDRAHRLTSVADTFGNHIQYTLDNMGKLTGEDRYDASNNHVYAHSWTFDSLSRLLHSVGASQQTTIYQYDDNSNLSSVADPLSHATQYSYDSLNRLTQTTTPDGNTLVGYNGLNQVTSVTDPRRLVTSYGIDALGNINQVTSPDSGAATRTFDTAGNTASRTDAKGQTLLYLYDALNRVTQIKRADTGQVLVSYTYDQADSAHTNGIGRLTSMTDVSGSTNWSYDQNGHVLKKTSTIGGSTLQTVYSYTAATGNVAQMTLPSGEVIGYTWTNGRISALIAAGSPLVSSITYQPFAGPKSWTLANGEIVTRAYDLDGRISSDPVETIAYDAASRVTGWTQGNHSALSGSQTFGYDNMDRINSYIGAGQQFAYTYDSGGNRLTEVINGGTVTFTIDPASNRITKEVIGGLIPTTYNYTYDANGSTTAVDVPSFGYNFQGQLSSYSYLLTFGSYTYNGEGQRVQKTSGLTTTLFNYDEASRIIGEYSAAGALVEETVYLGPMPIAVVQPPLIAGQTKPIYYVHADYRNVPRQIDNANKQPVWEWDPIPFGENLPNGQPSLLNPAFSFNMRFPGQYYDTESGVHDNIYRSYHPYFGRYLQSDPLGLAGGTNTYAYVRANPLAFVDPLGLADDTITDRIEALIAKGDTQGLQDLLDSGALNPDQEALSQGGLRTIDWLNNSSGNISKLADKFGRTSRQIKDAIHACKRNLPKGGPERNPDVIVDLRTGEVYPQLSNGTIGDSIGNIFDFLN